MEAHVMRSTLERLRLRHKKPFSHAFVHDTIYVEQSIPPISVLGAFGEVMQELALEGPRLKMKPWKEAMARADEIINTSAPAYNPDDRFRDIEQNGGGKVTKENADAANGQTDLVTWLHYGKIARRRA